MVEGDRQRRRDRGGHAGAWFRADRGGRPDRGQSETIGVVLLLAITVSGAAVVVGLGGIALGDIQTAAMTGSTENAMTQLDSRASLVAHGGSESQSVRLPRQSGEQLDLREDAGWMNVTVTNQSSGATTVVMNETMGAVVYERDGEVIAYQGGGVWRGEANASRMISPPEFHYRDGTLTLPVIAIQGEDALSERITIRQASPGDRKYPNASAGFQNPVSQKVTITIHSQYYRGWGEYLEERTEAGIDYDHDRNEVTITLVNPDGADPIKNAVLVNGGSGELQLQSGASPVINSYNSSNVPSDLGPSTEPSFPGSANLTTTMDISFGGNFQMTGNLETSGKIKQFKGSPGPPYRVGGHLKYGSGSVSNTECNKYVAEWCANNASIEDTEPINNEVQSTINDLSTNNDNANEPCFSESTAVDFSACGSTVRLEAGDYYTTQTLQPGSNKLLLDTTDGNIRIAVDDDQSVQFQGTNVTVIGDGRVEIYDTKQYQIQGGSTVVWNRGYDAPQLWLFCTANCQVQIKSGAEFVGTVYAPSKPGAGAQVQIDGGTTEVYGAVVGGGSGGSTSVKGNAEVHFDSALQSQKPFDSPTLPDISYLHVSVTRVNVTST